MTTLPQTTPIRVPRPIPAGSLAMPPAAGGLAVGAGPQSGGMTMADILRVIRQNMLLILLALMAGGILGYFVNAYLERHYAKYKAYGYVIVHSNGELPEAGKEEQPPQPEQVALIQETFAKGVVHEALFDQTISRPRPADLKKTIRDTEWFKSFENEADPLAARRKSLRDNLVASPQRGSQLVQIEMTTRNKEDAKVVLEDLIDTAIQNVTTRARLTEEGRIKLLTNQINLLQNELDQQIAARISEMERDLGKDNVEIYSAWNGKRMQLDTLLQEKTRIDRENAGLSQSLKSLNQDLADGKTPPEVQQLLSRDPRFVNAEQQVDQMDIVIGQLELKLGPQNEQTISNKKLRSAYQQKLDSIRERLKDEYSESYKSTLNNQLAAMNANALVIQDRVTTLGTELGKLNEKMTEYQVLKEKERRYRDKIAAYQTDSDRIKNLRMGVNWKQAEWYSLPTEPDAPVFPKLPLTMAVALVLSLALSLGIAFLRELTDTTVRSPRDIAKVGQLTLLGLIPHRNDDPQAEGSRLHLAILDAPNSHVAEQFRQIRTRLQYAHALDTTRSLLITSPSAEDGKTTVACNLAASLALNGRRILLVDANFRRPQLHSMFNVPNENGFGEVLTDLDKLPEAVRETDVPNLSVLVAGARPTNPTELLESQFFIDFIERVLEEYDHVIFDSGPMLMVSESVAMAPRVDGVVTVVRARGNSRGLLQRLRDEIRRVKAEHIGVVLNAVRAQGGGYYGRNIKSYYQYENQA